MTHTNPLFLKYPFQTESETQRGHFRICRVSVGMLAFNMEVGGDWAYEQK